MMAVPASRAATYARFVKLEHAIFSIPVILAGALLHLRGFPDARLTALMLVAAASARTVGMSLNRIMDAAIDARNPRTAARELASGRMSMREAWLITAFFTAIYAVSAAAIHPLCLKLAPIPVILFAIYPTLKRWTALAHLGLGLAWSAAPVGGWIAAAQTLEGLSKVAGLWLFALLWVTGFDIIYATMDEEFDRREGLHSLPARWGKRSALKAAAILHVAAFAALCWIYATQLIGPPAFVSLVLTGALFVWQHAVAERDPGFAFFQLNAAAGFLVLALVWSGVA